MPRPSAALSRRALLLAGGSATAFALTLRYRLAGRAPTAGTSTVSAKPDLPSRIFTDAQRKTLEGAQELLLPSATGSPGAREVRAIDYLERELASADIMPSVRERVVHGAARLDALAQAASAASFIALNEAQRSDVLNTLEDEEGGREWFETMLDFTLEAFLGDPVHGGNIGGVAWAWLGYTPGFPRPGSIP